MVRPLDSATPRSLPRDVSSTGSTAQPTTSTKTPEETTTTPTTTARRGHSIDSAESTTPMRMAADSATVADARARGASDTGAALREHRLRSASGDAVQADYGKEGAARFVSTRAVRGPEAERVRIAETTSVDINRGSATEQAEARRALLASSPQVNAAAVRAGNSQSICGAAAMTNALIMSDDHGSNAAALTSLAQKAGVTPSDAQQTALDHFREGNLSPQDVEHLQQLTYRVGVKGETGSEPGQRLSIEGLDLGIRESHYTPSRAERSALDQFRRDPTRVSEAQSETLRNMAFSVGVIDAPDAALDAAPPHQLTSGGMGAMAAALRGEGAFNGAFVSFHNSHLRDPRGHDFNHWTVDVAQGGQSTSFNSLSTRAGGPAQVTDVPGREIATSSSDRNFEGSVVVGPRRLVIDTPNDPDRMTHIEFAPGDDAPATWQRAYGGLARITNDRDPENPAFSVDEAASRTAGRDRAR